MNSLYVLWHTARQGWLTSNGVTSTEFKDAMKLDRAEAIKRCSRAYNKDAPVGMIIPVDINDLQAIGVQ